MAGALREAEHALRQREAAATCSGRILIGRKGHLASAPAGSNRRRFFLVDQGGQEIRALGSITLTTTATDHEGQPDLKIQRLGPEATAAMAATLD